MTDTPVLIAAQLQTLGYGTTSPPSPTIFIGNQPASPDAVLVVRGLTGEKPDKAFGVASVKDNPDVQIIVRKAKGQMSSLITTVIAIKADFDGKTYTISGKKFHWIELAYEPLYLGLDENERPSTSIVFKTKRDR